MTRNGSIAVCIIVNMKFKAESMIQRAKICS